MGFKQNLHTHSIYCDGKDTLEEMVLAAIAQGFDSIGFSGHSYLEVLKDFAMNDEAAAQYKREVAQLKETYKDRIEIFCGLEKDYNTSLDVSGYDYLLGSVHCMVKDGQYLFVDWDTDKLKYNIEAGFGGDGLAYAQHYYGEVAKLADSCPVDIIAHFDLVTKFSERINYFDTASEAYLKAALDAMDALTGKVPYFEVNTGAIARGYRTEAYPSAQLVKEFKKRGFGAVITTDCHDKNLLSFGYDEAKSYLIENGFTHHYILTKDGFRPESLFD